MVLFAVLDGACCGCFVCVLPAALQALLEDAPEPLPHSPTRTGAVLAALLLGALLGGAGRALSAFLNALSLSKSSLLAVLLCAITFFVFSFSSSLAWLLSLRLVLGVLSGYLGYFVEVDRASGLSRAAWVLTAGAACCMCAALYATPHSSQSHSSQSLLRWQPVRTNSPFLLEHPLCLSLSMLAASVIAFFAFYVLAEKFGVLDDDDERLYRASSSYMPISGPLEGPTFMPNGEDSVNDGGESGRPRLLSTSSSGDSSGGGASRHLLSSGGRSSTSQSTLEEGLDMGTVDLQVPGRFLRGCQGDHAEALRRWRLTLEWRRDYRVDGILAEPQPHFFAIKKHYPHFLHGRSVSGNHALYYEQLGKIDLVALRELGIGVPQLLRHYIFMAEYLWTHVEPDFEHGKSITVLDVGGVSVSDLVGDPLDFLKESTKLIQNHYVERSQKIFVVNASYMFSWLWRMVQPMINESTRRKISILSSDMSELVDYVGQSALPEAYGGQTGVLGGSEEERKLAMFVHKLNSQCQDAESSSNNFDSEAPPISATSTSAANYNYGSVLASPSSPSSGVELSSTAPRSLSRAANSRRRRMKGSRKVKGNDQAINRGGDKDENELGYSNSDSYDDDISDTTYTNEEFDDDDASDHENFHLSMMPNFMSDFYDKSVETIRRTFYNKDEAKTVFLGSENQFTFTDGKWVEKKESRLMRRSMRNQKVKRRRKDGKLDCGTGSSTSHSEDESDDTTIIRAIQAVQGYVSESETESENMSYSRRLRRSFRRHISQKKQEALQRVSWWSWLHWCWRAALFVSLESLPVLLLLDQRHGGLGLPPIYLGCSSLLCAGIIWRVQPNATSRPSRGFFKHALTVSLSLEVLSIVVVITLCLAFKPQQEWTFEASPVQMSLLVTSLTIAFATLLFSFGTTVLFSAAVMTSCKSPLYAPFSRSKACMADALGGAIGIGILLLADLGQWAPLSAIMVTLAITASVHLCIAIFDYVNPHAAGKGVQLQALAW